VFRRSLHLERARHRELGAGVRATTRFTVGQCRKDWLETPEHAGRDHLTGYRIMARHVIELIGKVKLVDLNVSDVQFALG
jgi:hypothetical protein